MVSITPVEMVKLYLDRRKGEITNIPKTGLVDASYKRIEGQSVIGYNISSS